MLIEVLKGFIKQRGSDTLIVGSAVFQVTMKKGT